MRAIASAARQPWLGHSRYDVDYHWGNLLKAAAISKRWQAFTSQLREQSGRGLSNTIIRCQALRPSLHDLRDQFARMMVPVLLMVGDEDVHCLETNLMLKSTLPNAGLWISPNTGHSINLEEPAAFNAQVDTFITAVQRGSWRRGYPTNESKPRNKPPELRVLTNCITEAGEEIADAKVIALHQEQSHL
jgi:pimeloyl-ACP methyl ester carboxylesterase